MDILSLHAVVLITSDGISRCFMLSLAQVQALCIMWGVLSLKVAATDPSPGILTGNYSVSSRIFLTVDTVDCSAARDTLSVFKVLNSILLMMIMDFSCRLYNSLRHGRGGGVHLELKTIGNLLSKNEAETIPNLKNLDRTRFATFCTPLFLEHINVIIIDKEITECKN